MFLSNKKRRFLRKKFINKILIYLGTLQNCAVYETYQSTGTANIFFLGGLIRDINYNFSSIIINNKLLPVELEDLWLWKIFLCTLSKGSARKIKCVFAI